MVQEEQNTENGAGGDGLSEAVTLALRDVVDPPQTPNTPLSLIHI